MATLWGTVWEIGRPLVGGRAWDIASAEFLNHQQELGDAIRALQKATEKGLVL